MSPYMQAKILRAMDTRKIYRLGGKKSIPLNVRIVAATNQDPEAAMPQGTLRQDLFYRLNVARVHLPPLRERQLDIPLLLQHFLQEMNCRYGRRVEKFTPDVMALLLGYSWPGNIRELRNLVEALFINLDPQSQTVSLTHLPEAFQRLHENLEKSLGEKEQLLKRSLDHQLEQERSRQKLRISRMTLYRKMEKFEIQAPKRRRATNLRRDISPTPLVGTPEPPYLPLSFRLLKTPAMPLNLAFCSLVGECLLRSSGPCGNPSPVQDKISFGRE